MVFMRVVALPLIMPMMVVTEHQHIVTPEAQVVLMGVPIVVPFLVILLERHIIAVCRV